MGNSANSTALLDVPIERAVAPFRLSKHDVVVDALTRLRLEPPCWSCNHYQAFDADDTTTTTKSTAQPRYNLQRMVSSYRVQILTHDNLVVLSVEEKAFEGYFRVFEGTERDHESFRVRVRGSSSDAVIWIEFQDRISGDTVRVSTHGHCGDRVALFYMERHAAELPPMPKGAQAAAAIKRGKVIGRVRRAELGEHEFLVATKGVDLTLLLVLWIVRHDIEERRGTVGSVPKLTKLVNIY